MNKTKTELHIILGGLISAIYVILGAFGAHGLKPLLSEKQLNTCETGLRYMIIHALALILINLVYTVTKKYSKWPNILFYVGLLFFSASLIIHATKDLIGISVDVFALLAPIGGLAFVFGWLSFAHSIYKK